MPWRGPEYEGEFPSLGWDVLEWAEKHLTVPDGKFAGEPLVLTDEQAAIVVRFYGIDDHGKWLFRRAAVRRAQGWGKSPLLASIAAAELCGPTRFGGWSADGEPVGVPPTAPWVQVAAVSEDQTENTYAALYAMLADSDLNGSVLDVGLTRIYLKGETGRLEPVTAAAGTRLGQRITFAVLDEPHLWTRRNGGLALAATIRRNAGKMGGRTFESTNAHMPGEDSVAERTFKAAQNAAPGLLYDSVEPAEVEDLTDRAAVLAALKVAYGDSVWVDLDRLADEVADPGTDPDDARRFYFNQLVAGADRPVDIRAWETLDKTRVVEPGERIGLGFDGSVHLDSTALYGCTTDGHIFEVRTWEKPDGVREWTVPRLEVHAAVAEAFEKFDVGRMFCDPPKWATEVDTWSERWNPERAEDAIVLALETNQARRFAPACDRFATAVRERALSHDGGEGLTLHLAAAKRVKVRIRDDDDDGRTRFVIDKADTRKIDRAVAAILAYEAAMTMPDGDEEVELW